MGNRPLGRQRRNVKWMHVAVCSVALCGESFEFYCLRVIKKLIYKVQINGDKSLRRHSFFPITLMQ
jgi:hypothetical protein